MTTKQGTPLDPRKRLQTREAVLEHLWRLLPQHCLILTDPRTRTAIEAGMTRAQRHGFRTQSDVCGFVTLMVLLGAEFDVDPQLPWAGACLRNEQAGPRRAAMADLLTKATEEMEPAIGPDGGLYRSALAWARDHDFDVVAASSMHDQALHDFMHQMYRPKYELLGEPLVQELVRQARDSARAHRLTTSAGVGVVLQLIFLLGIGFMRDPFHPWVTDALRDADRLDSTERARRLHTKGLAVMSRYRRLTRLQHVGVGQEAR